jgi:uncharacterized protein (DUF1330 family)
MFTATLPFSETWAWVHRDHEIAIRVSIGSATAAPKNVAIVEWDSLDDAKAFYKSKAWTDLAPQRDKTQKTIRRYVVEVER